MLGGICKMLVGNTVRPIWGLRAPPAQLAKEPWATSPPKEESLPSPGPSPPQPPAPAAAVSLRASPSLLLCSPHLCRSRGCGSELHGETPLQVRFLGVWSVPSFPHPSPALPRLVTYPPPPPPTEGAGGWAWTLYYAPGSVSAGQRGTVAAARGGRAVLTADHLPRRSSVSLPSHPPPCLSGLAPRSHPSPPTPPPRALPASPRKPPLPPALSLPPLPHPHLPAPPLPLPLCPLTKSSLISLPPSGWLSPAPFLGSSLSRSHPFPHLT